MSRRPSFCEKWLHHSSTAAASHRYLHIAGQWKLGFFAFPSRGRDGFVLQRQVSPLIGKLRCIPDPPQTAVGLLCFYPVPRVPPLRVHTQKTPPPHLTWLLNAQIHAQYHAEYSWLLVPQAIQHLQQQRSGTTVLHGRSASTASSLCLPQGNNSALSAVPHH